MAVIAADDLVDQVVSQSCEALTLDELAGGALALVAKHMHLEFAACYEESQWGVAGRSPDHLPPILDDYAPYVANDPLHALKRRGLPPLAVTTRLVDRASLRSSAVYNELYRPRSLIHHVIMQLDRKETSLTGVVLCKGDRRGDFDADELRLLNRILRPLCATARRLHRFDDTINRVSLLERLLDTADPTARVVVNADGRVVWASPLMHGSFAAVLDGLTRDHPVIKAAMALCRGDAENLAHEVTCTERLFKAELTLVRSGSNSPVVEARLRDDPTHRFVRWTAEQALTPAEVSVLKQLSVGATNQEIARALFISIHTVRTHLNRIFKKLGTSSRLETVVAARDAGI